MKLLRKLVVVLILLSMIAVGAMFAIQNETPVPLDILIHVFEPKSLALWLLLFFALGGVLGMIASSGILIKMRASVGTSQRQLEKSKLENDKLLAATTSDAS